MANKKGRPKGSGQVIDYKKLQALARYQAMQQELALEMGISEEEFSRKLHSNKAFKDAFTGGQNRGRMQARKVLFDGMLDHYFTFCTNPDCGQIQDDPYQFHPRCPQCNSMGFGEKGPDGTITQKYYPVKHKREPGDRELIKFFAKNFLNMSDRVTIEGDKDKPLVFSTLADFALHQAAKENAQKKQTKDESSD